MVPTGAMAPTGQQVARGVGVLAPNNPPPLGEGEHGAHGAMAPTGQQVAHGVGVLAPNMVLASHGFGLT